MGRTLPDGDIEAVIARACRQRWSAVLRMRKVISVFGVAVALGSIALGLVYLMTPRWGAKVLAWTSPGVTYFVRTGEPRVALTIDDSPDVDETPAILDVLRENGSRATFFIIGEKVAGNEALLDRMRTEGHELANHTYRGRMSLPLTDEELAEELAATHRLLARYGDVRWFRPGSGFYSPGLLRVAKSSGYQTALADVYPGDARLAWPAFHAWYIVRNARPGSIIVLHDGKGRGRRAAETLGRVLPELKRRGLSAVTLSEMCSAPSGGPGGR